ncbi:unnamed protein product, partial [marine sediment metagenome]
EFIGYQDISIVNEKLLNEIIHPDDLQKLLNSEEGKEIEFRIVTKQGKIKWLQGKRLNQYPSILYIEVCFPLPFEAFHTSSAKLLRISWD